MSSTTISIKGMTCGHCEGRVTAELKKIDGVTEVVASAESANAVITSTAEIAAASIEKAIVDAGYKLA
ncbi:MAG: heavy-metal-associated domain-containing protein [Actinobacteria bacterium]|nr:copper chaperone [Actinomycetota bacterium]NQW64536.1 heavy-metal-associated domain-containing protein [Actinomycetota bacterium]